MLPILVLIVIVFIIKNKIRCSYIYYILMYYYISLNKEKTCNSYNDNLPLYKEKTYDSYNDILTSYKEKTYNSYNDNLPLYKEKSCTIYNNLAPYKTNIQKTLCEIPVILGEYILEIPLEHNLEFNEKILRIRNIENKVYINKYTIIWGYKHNEPNSNNKLHIFINGTLTRNIEYSFCENITDSYIKTSIKELIQEVPFENAFCVQCPYAPNNPHTPSNNIKLHVKKTSIYHTNFSSKIEPISQNTFRNMYLIKNLHSKIIMKLQIDLTEKRQVYL